MQIKTEMKIIDFIFEPLVRYNWYKFVWWR